MKSGIELIAEERQEQIKKHGWTAEHDHLHEDGELKFAAMYAIKPHPTVQTGIKCYSGWDEFTERVDNKTEVQRLIVAGALIAAEIDRLNNLK